jgi:3-hydroxyacyl-CoA dehydrogenase
LFLPMLTEATRIVESGIAASPRDVDAALRHGIGFPAAIGGIFGWCDRVGAGEILRQLRRRQSLGVRFEPTDMLHRLASQNGTSASRVCGTNA